MLLIGLSVFVASETYIHLALSSVSLGFILFLGVIINLYKKLKDISQVEPTDKDLEDEESEDKTIELKKVDDELKNIANSNKGSIDSDMSNSDVKKDIKQKSKTLEKLKNLTNNITNNNKQVQFSDRSEDTDVSKT